MKRMNWIRRVTALALFLFLWLGLGLAALAEDTAPALRIGASFFDARSDGRISLEIRLDFIPGTDASAAGEARDVRMTVEGDNGMTPSVRSMRWEAIARYETVRLECVYAEPEESAGREEAGDPHIIVRVESANCGSLVYTATLDVRPTARALIVYEAVFTMPDGTLYVPKVHAALESSADTMLAHYDASHALDGRPFRAVKLALPGPEVGKVPELLSVLDPEADPILDDFHPDDNDLTYLYIDAHGLINDKTLRGRGIIELYNPDDINNAERKGMGLPYAYLFRFLQDRVRGRMVLILDKCFSGTAIEAAEGILDPRRFLIITSTTAEFATTNPGYIGDYFLTGRSSLSRFFDTMEEETSGSDVTLGRDCAEMAGGIGENLLERLGDKIDRDILHTPSIRFLPQVWGNTVLPLLIRNPGYRDGYALPALKAESVVCSRTVLTGEVKDAETGSPLAGVSVTAAASGQTRTAVTDYEGAFAFESLPAGICELTFEKEGFRTVSTAAAVGEDVRTSLPNPVLLPLADGWHHFSGRVLTQVNRRNGAASGAQVRVSVRRDGAFVRAGDILLTDRDGAYTFVGRPGTYLVEAFYGGMTDDRETALDADRREVPDLLAGVTLAGRITDSVTGNPVKAVIVTVTHEDGTRDGTVSDEDGRWTVNVQNGESVRVDFVGAGYENGNAAYDSSFTAGRSFFGADIALPPERTAGFGWLVVAESGYYDERYRGDGNCSGITLYPADDDIHLIPGEDGEPAKYALTIFGDGYEEGSFSVRVWHLPAEGIAVVERAHAKSTPKWPRVEYCALRLDAQRRFGPFRRVTLEADGTVCFRIGEAVMQTFSSLETAVEALRDFFRPCGMDFAGWQELTWTTGSIPGLYLPDDQQVTSAIRYPRMAPIDEEQAVLLYEWDPEDSSGWAEYYGLPDADSVEQWYTAPQPENQSKSGSRAGKPRPSRGESG